MRRLKPRWAWFVPPFYWTCMYLLRAVLTVVARWKVEGREHIPKAGAVVVVANHLNNADAPILGAAIARRRVRYMAKIELFKWPFGIAPRLFGAFPVRRFEADMAAMLNAERLLKRGEVLGMFPEGTRSKTGYLGAAHPGTALITLRSGAAVLPCAIDGTEQLRNPLVVFRQPRIHIKIGEPFKVEQIRRPTQEQVEELTVRMMSAITEMLPAKYARPYTGMEEAEDSSDGGDHPGT